MDKKQKPTVESFIGGKVIYDNAGQYFFGKHGQQMVAELRGWGAIQNMFPITEQGQNDAAKFQDELGEWIADAINQKLRTTNGNQH